MKEYHYRYLLIGVIWIATAVASIWIRDASPFLAALVATWILI